MLVKSNLPHWQSIHTIVFDFDGVFTDNKVLTNQDGVESVRCDRSDGLAFDILRKFAKKNSWNVSYFILSKEVNTVVAARARKLNVTFSQGNNDKVDYLTNYLARKNLDASGLIYVGNDLNDLGAMLLAGCSVAPSDAHPVILRHASVKMAEKGGESFVRALIEALIGLDQMTTDELLHLL